MRASRSTSSSRATRSRPWRPRHTGRRESSCWASRRRRSYAARPPWTRSSHRPRRHSSSGTPPRTSTSLQSTPTASPGRSRPMRLRTPCTCSRMDRTASGWRAAPGTWRCGRHWRRLGSPSGWACLRRFVAHLSSTLCRPEHERGAPYDCNVANQRRVHGISQQSAKRCERDRLCVSRRRQGTPPLVLLQHFRGNVDNWDPALIDALATDRRVVTFDNAGVGGSTGTTPSTITQLASDAIAFLEAMDFDRVDVLGFSIGSFVARPSVARTRTGAVPSTALAVVTELFRDWATPLAGERVDGKARELLRVNAAHGAS